MTTNPTLTQAPTTGPRNVFLTTSEVFTRYRWKRTKGYEMLKSPGFPRSVGGAYRFDTLLSWEDAILTGVLEATAAAESVPQEPATLPARRRSSSSAKAA